MDLSEAAARSLRVALCDDNPIEADFIGEQLEEYAREPKKESLTCFRFSSGEELSRAYEQGRRFDVCLLDIVLPGMDGLTLAKTLQSGREKPEIVFLTNSEEYVLEAWQVRASGYLIKPVSRRCLFEALDTAFAAVFAARDRVKNLVLPATGRTLSFLEIVVVETGPHTLRMLLAHGEEVLYKAGRAEITGLVKQLENDSHFLRPGRSTLVNAAHVDKLGKHTFLMDNGVQVKIGKTRFTSIRQRYADYLTESGGW